MELKNAKDFLRRKQVFTSKNTETSRPWESANVECLHGQMFICLTSECQETWYNFWNEVYTRDVTEMADVRVHVLESVRTL